MIYVRMTNGFGNNLFQYIAARLLAEHHNTQIVAIPPVRDYYARKPLENLGITFGDFRDTASVIPVRKDYKKYFDLKYKNENLVLLGYFEDYTYYLANRNLIRSWFPEVMPRNDSALVVHIRTGDRLSNKDEFYNKPQIEDYHGAIAKFDFERLHIVTDMPQWKCLTVNELKKIQFHTDFPDFRRVPIEESVNFFNSLVEGFEKYDPIVEKREVYEDFQFIRTFRNILFEHGTLSWWAAFLSDAEKVGVYGPWRSWKGKRNRNLSHVKIDGWFKWYKRY